MSLELHATGTISNHEVGPDCCVIQELVGCSISRLGFARGSKFANWTDHCAVYHACIVLNGADNRLQTRCACVRACSIQRRQKLDRQGVSMTKIVLQSSMFRWSIGGSGDSDARDKLVALMIIISDRAGR